MNLLLTTASLGAAVLILPWLWDNFVIVGRRLWATRGVPEPPVRWSQYVLGHIPALVQSRYRSFRCFHTWSLKWPVFRIRFFLRPVVVVTDPDVYQPLLRQGPSNLPKYTAPYRMFEVFTKPERANVLTSSENSTWKAVRQATVAALTMNNLRLCFPQITAVTQRLIRTLSAAGPTAVLDMDAIAAAITVDVIGLAAFNRDLQATCTLPAHARASSTSNSSLNTDAAHALPGAQQDAPRSGSSSAGTCAVDTQHQQAGEGAAVAAAHAAGICDSVVFPRGHEVLDVIGHLVVAMQGRTNPLNRWFPWRQAYRDLFYWGARMSDLVRDLYSSMQQTPPPRHSLGAHLLQAKYSTGEPISQEQIMAEIGIMWGAGFETTAHTICWTLFLLASHPEAEARLCAELDSLGFLTTATRPTPGPLQWEHLAQLKYLSAVINESMRLFPAVSSGTVRITDRPITLAGHRLPAGQPIIIPFWAVHRSPRLWQDPDSFRPERFLAPDTAAPTEKTFNSNSNSSRTTGEIKAAAAAGPSHEDQADKAEWPDSSWGSSTTEDTPAEADTGEGGEQPGDVGVCAPGGLIEDDDYVDVAADMAAIRDQALRQGNSPGFVAEGKGHTISKPVRGTAMQTTTSSSSSSNVSDVRPDTKHSKHASADGADGGSRPRADKTKRPALELKDPTVDRRGFLPFSIGSRNCVGQALALVELKAVLALLVSSFSFSLHPSMGGVEGVEASAKQTVTLRPEHGLLMTLTPREALAGGVKSDT